MDAAEDRPPARPVQPVRARRRDAGARRRRDAAGRGRRRVAGADRDLPRQRARRHRLRRGAARAVPRARASARSRRTSPSPCSAARRRRTSGSRSTSAGRSSRPPTRAPVGAVAIGEALGAIRAGEIDAAIAGGVEIPLSPLAFGAFDIIRALSGGSQRRRRARLPAVRREARRVRHGRGRGAARARGGGRRPRARGAEPYAEVMGYGATSDAFHMVQPRADGSRGRAGGDDRPGRRRRSSRSRSTSSAPTRRRRRSATSRRHGRSRWRWARTSRRACR